MQKYKCLITLFAVLFLLCSCSGSITSSSAKSTESSASLSETSAETISSPFGQIYEIYGNTGTLLYMNEYGNVLPEKEANYYAVRDILTNDVAYYVRSYYELSAEADEYTTEAVNQYEELYTPDGKLVCEKAMWQYGSAIGKYIVRHEPTDYMYEIYEGYDAESALIDPETGKVIADDVYSVTRLSDTSAVCCDFEGKILGIIADNGQVVAGFPAPVTAYYPQVCNGYINACDYRAYYHALQSDSNTDEKPLNYIFDNNLNIYMSDKCFKLDNDYYGLFGDYIYYYKDRNSGGTVFDLNTRDVVYVVPEGFDICFFDGEHMVLEERSDVVPYKYSLHNANGEMICGPYEIAIFPDTYDVDGETKPDFLIVYDGTVLEKIDLDGNVLASREISNVYYVSFYDTDRIVCSIQVRNGNAEHQYSNMELMLDENLENVIEPEKYEHFQGIIDQTESTSKRLGRFYGCKTNINGFEKYDLLDKDGNVLLDNISHIGTETDKALAIVRGFSVGLIDLDGNWIAKHPLYDVIDSD